MIYLLDTNALSELVRKQPSIEKRIKEVGDSAAITTCVIAVGEILQGVERLPAGRKRDGLREQVQAVLSAIPSEPIPNAAAAAYTRIKTERDFAGRPMGANDLWIAATVLALDAVLVTNDKDFMGISGLSIEDWTD